MNPNGTTTQAIDWLFKAATYSDALQTGTSATFIHFGLVLLSIFAAFGLVRLAINTVARMLGFWHHIHFEFGEIVLYLFQILLAAWFLKFYSVPIPGTMHSVHQFPSYIALQLTQQIDMSYANDLNNQIINVTQNLSKPGFMDFLQTFVYLSIMGNMILISVCMFVVTAYSYVIYGVLVLFGPLCIPFLATKNFKGMFFGWLQNMFSICMIRVVAAGLTYVFARMLMDFFTNSVNSHYDLGTWLALLMGLVPITAAFLYATLKVPLVTERLFGGLSAMAGNFSDSVTSFVAKAVA